MFIIIFYLTMNLWYTVKYLLKKKAAINVDYDNKKDELSSP